MGWKAPDDGLTAGQRYAKRHPERVKAKQRRRMLRHYGITAQDYDRMMEEQGSVCAICEGINPSGHRLSIDHDHETGEVRGLLCHACNAGIGKLRDDPVLCLRAAQYLAVPIMEQTKGGVIHTGFRLNNTVTGRMSSGGTDE